MTAHLPAGPPARGRGGALTSAMRGSAHLTVRQLRSLLHQPVTAVVTLIQPLIWLLLFGSLFRRVIDIPGFQGRSYIAYLVPGVAVMLGYAPAGANGYMMLRDMERGALDWFLVTPVQRVALLAGPLGYQAVLTVTQSLIIVSAGFALGARYPGGPAGITLLLAALVLLFSGLAATSSAVSLLLRREQALIGYMQVIGWPLTLLSTAFVPAILMPGWVRAAAAYNPVNWAVVAGRQALGARPAWSIVASRLAFLTAFAAVLLSAALAAFRSYQRSV